MAAKPLVSLPFGHAGYKLAGISIFPVFYGLTFGLAIV